MYERSFLRILEYVGTLVGKVIAVVSSVTLEKLCLRAVAVGHQEGHFSAAEGFAFNPRAKRVALLASFFLACLRMIFIYIASLVALIGKRNIEYLYFMTQ